MELSRRYFFMNAFDGVLTVFGVLIGAFLGSVDPKALLLSIAGVTVAMSISGFSGAYVTESAEREKDIHEIEAVTLQKSDEDDVFTEAGAFASFFVAFVDGMAPAAGSLPMAVPFLLAITFPGVFVILHLFILAFLVGAVELFLLGMAIGKISDRSPVRFGFVMLLMGIIVGFLTMVFENLLEL